MRSPVAALVLLATLAAPRGASAACSPVTPDPANDRAANVACTGVRVGMELSVPSQKWGDYPCAASFAFTDQSGARYLTFPGSCFLDYDCLEDAVYDELPPPLNQLVPRLPTCILPSDSELEPNYGRRGPVVNDAGGHRVGRIAYAVNKDGFDFALLRVDPEVRLDPSVPFYGGPTRIGVGADLEEVRVWSPPRLGLTPNARTGVLQVDETTAYVLTESETSLAPGSSVIRTDGTAVGLFTGTDYLGWGYETQTLKLALGRAFDHTGLRLTLMTAPLTKH